MIRVMDMSTGKTEEEVFEAEFGQYKDEVLNAGWLAPGIDATAMVRVGLQEVHVAKSAAADIDPEAFLSRIYRSQG